MTRPERDAVLAFLARIAGTTIGAEAILAGSTGVFGASETIPALTDDLDLAVEAEWLAENDSAVRAELAALGFRHVPGTCTFVGADGLSLDLIGYSRRDREDRVGGGDVVPVMVFGDLSEILSRGAAVRPLPGGGRAMSPAALAAAKLLTVRLEKGGKDKLQALLIVAERADEERFAVELRSYLEGFPRDRVEDAIGDAQAAFLTISGDATRADPGSAGYARFVAAVERGLAALRRIVGSGT